MSRPPAAKWTFFGIGAILSGLLVATSLVTFTNFQQLGNLIQVVRLVHAEYVESVDGGKLIEGAIRGVVESLDDPYSVYLEPETFDRFMEQVKGRFGGVGILIGHRDEDLTVMRPFDGTPAAEAGILTGDVILAVDGKETRGMSLETVVMLIRGDVGSDVQLTIGRDGYEEPLEFTVVRQQIQVPTVEGELLDGDIGHVVLSQFAENTSGEFIYVLNSFDRDLRGLILDLRNNPGGDLIAAVEVADVFIDEGPIVHIRYRTNRDQTFSADRQQLDVPLVVLVNRNSASAAEIVAGAIKDTGVGTLVGTKTFGKGVVQNIFELGNGAGLKLTTAWYLTPSGHNLDQEGIEPHVVVDDPLDLDADPQLDKALEILKAGNR